jgi:hypothetical protein
MSKPIGGRGNKAPYETTHVRVPTPIKSEVERLIEEFREGRTQQQENSLTSLEDAVKAAREILKQKKSARVSVEKLLTAIYGKNVEL